MGFPKPSLFQTHFCHDSCDICDHKVMCLLPSYSESILKAQPYWGVNTKHPQPLVCTGALPHLFELAGGRIVSFPQDGRVYSEEWDLHTSRPSEYRARLQPGPNPRRNGQ